MPEFIDIYNENKEKTGVTADRKTVFLKEGQYMLYVLALIENANHEFLITQRSLTKKWAAGAWEIPGGGSMANETSFDAVVREVKEETGLDVSQYACEPIYWYKNIDLKRGDNYFVDIYHFTFDFNAEDVTIETSEAIGYRLATIEEVENIQKTDGFLHYERILQALDAEKKQA